MPANTFSNDVSVDAPTTRQPSVRDGLIRTVLIPVFGIAIPLVTDLYGPIRPLTQTWWIGQAWFLLTSFTIYHGNRWLLFRHRRRFSWIDRPIQKLLVLVGANVFFTAPMTVLFSCIWCMAIDWQPLPVNTILTTVLVNVICVLFVTHVYETMFLIREREEDVIRVERHERARVQAELTALRGQVDPHVMFNSLNTLTALIETDPSKAVDFAETLADVYRDLLIHGRRDLVPVEDEFVVVRRYIRLLVLRFGEAVRLDVMKGAERGFLIPSMALQTVIENAVKHNVCSVAEPLVVAVSLDGAWIVVDNPIRPRELAHASTRTGITTLDERSRLLLGRGVIVDRTEKRFRVMIPVTSAPVSYLASSETALPGST